MTTPTQTRSRLPSRGLTLIEVILAMVLLAMLSASVFGALGAIDSMQRRNQMLLAANEVANRLLLTRLDDKKAMPPKSEAIAYGPFQFLYDLTEEKVRIELNRKQTSLDSVPQGLDRFQQLTLTVYQAELVNGMPRSVEQVAQIQRIIDPFTVRNRESLKRIEKNPNEFIESIFNYIGNGGAPSDGDRPNQPNKPGNR